jgi:hypothetical protein
MDWGGDILDGLRQRLTERLKGGNPMSGTEYSQVSKEKLLELCSRSLNTLDGLWFLSVESKYDFDTALELDLEVWRKASLIHGERVVKIFGIQKNKPIEAFVKLVRVDPLKFAWKSEIMMLSDNKAVLRRTECPPQEARIRAAKDTFPGDAICLAMYTAYAEVIDPRIKISCLTSPPCAPRPQCWCEWQFEI